MTTRVRSHAALAAALVTAAALLAACGQSGPPDPRPLTTEESQLLAIARFKNFDAGARNFFVQVQDGGFLLSVGGYVDYRTGVGYASLAEGTTRNSLLLWQGGTLAVHEPAATDVPPLPPPDADSGAGLGPEWRVGALDPSGSTLHSALALVAGLGNDRPENPLLIQQGGALWLREDTLYGTPVTVFSGPTGAAAGDAAPAESRVRYWVAADGLLMAVETKLGQTWYTIEFGPADGVALDYPIAAAG